MPRRTVVAWAALLFAGAGLAVTGARLLPQAWSASRLLQAADDPAALAHLRLPEVLSRTRMAAEIDAALAAEDEELAQSFVELADGHGIPIDASRREAVAELMRGGWSRSARAFAQGAMTGTADSAAGLAGTLAADVTGLGDARDLMLGGPPCAREAPDCDWVVVGLAAVGFAATAATWAGGLGAPARGGVTILKAARKLRRLSQPLTESLTRTIQAGVDPAALDALAGAAKRLDFNALHLAAAAAIRPAALHEFGDLGRGVFGLYKSTDARGVLQVLSVAHAPAEVVRAERLAARFGTRTRAILKVLGREALVVSSALTQLVLTVLGAAAWFLGLAMFCRSLGLRLGRTFWPSSLSSTPTGNAASPKPKRVV